MTTSQAIEMVPATWTEQHVVAYLAVYYVRTIRRIYRNAR